MAWSERDGDKRQDLTEALIQREIMQETGSLLINILIPIPSPLYFLPF